MNRRVFLDVGANTGQTLKAVLDPEFRFDRIVCFEPASVCWPKLKLLADKRVSIARFGLWHKTCIQPIFAPGEKGGSLWRRDHSKYERAEICDFRRARDWFADNVDEGDTVFLKLNCEGAECDILDDLLDSGEFRKISFALIDFDVRKIRSEKHREAELRERLKAWPFPRVAFSKDVMAGPTHEARIKNWLRLVVQ
jgi:FkbM family methyltransferase